MILGASVLADTEATQLPTCVVRTIKHNKGVKQSTGLSGESRVF